MMKILILLISCHLVFINARPERTKNEASDVESVEIIESKPYSKISTSGLNQDNKDHERKTKEILEKIDQVNKNLGYVQDRNKPERKLYYGIFSKSEQNKKPVTTSDLFQSGLKDLAKIVGVDIDSSNISSKERMMNENRPPQYFLFPIRPDHRSVSFVNNMEQQPNTKTDFELLKRTITQIKDIVSNVHYQNYPIFKQGNTFVIPSVVKPTITEAIKPDQETRRSIGNSGPANSPMVIIPINDNSEKIDRQYEEYEYEYDGEFAGRENTKRRSELKRPTPSTSTTLGGMIEDKRDSRRRYKKPESTESSKILGIKLPQHFGLDGQKFGNGNGASGENSTKDTHNQIGGDKKKLWSRDNTGSGIFIQRLKVRKGGVAIAGPGGIATAGSGGTAIVGPSGVAYTQPDSVAIAGAGSKVVAVDAGINLTDLVHALQNMNRSNENEFVPRIGKVVATGPVIYYNRG